MSDDLPDHSNYAVLKGEYDPDKPMKTVLLDKSGAIVAILKGYYVGELTPVALDKTGAIRAVLTDPEDVFGNPNYIGAGELAARLGSIKRYDKRGEVVFVDDFEDSTLKWDAWGDGDGNSQHRSNVAARSGNYSLKLTTGDTAGNSASMDRYALMPVKTKIGFEFSFALSPNLDALNNLLYVYDGETWYAANISYNPYLDELSIVDHEGHFQVIASDLKLRESDFMFHTWKQVIDLETKKYVRCFLDNVEYKEVSEYSFRTSLSGVGPCSYFQINIRTKTTANNYAYIDDVIYTQNEP